jgi:hypothetical protein
MRTESAPKTRLHHRIEQLTDEEALHVETWLALLLAHEDDEGTTEEDIFAIADADVDRSENATLSMDEIKRSLGLGA